MLYSDPGFTAEKLIFGEPGKGRPHRPTPPTSPSLTSTA